MCFETVTGAFDIIALLFFIIKSNFFFSFSPISIKTAIYVKTILIMDEEHIDG